jgi:hypothetical protein
VYEYGIVVNFSMLKVDWFIRLNFFSGMLGTTFRAYVAHCYKTSTAADLAENRCAFDIYDS